MVLAATVTLRFDSLWYSFNNGLNVYGVPVGFAYKPRSSQ